MHAPAIAANTPESTLEACTPSTQSPVHEVVSSRRVHRWARSRAVAFAAGAAGVSGAAALLLEAALPTDVPVARIGALEIAGLSLWVVGLGWGWWRGARRRQEGPARGVIRSVLGPLVSGVAAWLLLASVLLLVHPAAAWAAERALTAGALTAGTLTAGAVMGEARALGDLVALQVGLGLAVLLGRVFARP